MSVRLVAPPHVDVVWLALTAWFEEQGVDPATDWADLDEVCEWFLEDYAVRLGAPQATSFLPGTTMHHPQARPVTKWSTQTFTRAIVDAIQLNLIEHRRPRPEAVEVRPVPVQKHTSSRLCRDDVYKESK